MPEERLKPFKNPPIKEAIFGIAFKDPVDYSLLTAFKASDVIKEQFPKVMPGMMVELMANTHTTELTTEQKPDGYQLRSANENNRLLQVRTTQLTYHNLTRYDGWDTMIVELKTLWSAFCLVVGKTQLSQLSVRYINHISLPLPMEQGMGEYINLLPQIPEGINPGLNNFFLQIQIPLTNNVKAVVTETILTPQPDDNKINFLLDLNVTKAGRFQCNEKEMWEAFSELRWHKNDLFQKCLTPTTIKFFDE